MPPGALRSSIGWFRFEAITCGERTSLPAEDFRDALAGVEAFALVTGSAAGGEGKDALIRAGTWSGP